jgi:hypothetical protein
VGLVFVRELRFFSGYNLVGLVFVQELGFVVDII